MTQTTKPYWGVTSKRAGIWKMSDKTPAIFRTRKEAAAEAGTIGKVIKLEVRIIE